MSRPDFRVGDRVFPKDVFGRPGEGKVFRHVVVISEPQKVSGVWSMNISDKYDSGWNMQVKCSKWYVMSREVTIYDKIRRFYMKLSKSAIVTGVVLLVILFFGLWFTGNYNSLVSSKAAVDNSWAKVETQYQRRFDLIDNVVASVKGSQLQEQKVFGDIAKARTQYNDAKTTDEKAEAASSVETNVALIPRLQEAYPELRSNEQVTKLIAELGGTENSIAGVRDEFNNTATNYNVGITRFPKSIFAGLFDFEKVSLFKATSGAEKAPKVNFGENN